MQGAVFSGPNNLKVKEVPVPEGGIKARVRACAVCGYDVRVFRNGHRKVRPPVILGHEICAELVGPVETPGGTIGSGTRVAVYPQVPCLDCQSCERKRYNLCLNLKELGSTYDGGFAEFVKIPENLVKIGGLVPIPPQIGDDQAALLEPLACCLNSVSRTAAQTADEPSIVIFGDGPIGLMHLQLFKLMARARVCLVGRVDVRMQMAKRLGADTVISFIDDESIGQNIMGNFAGAGADAVIVATSNPLALKIAEKIAGKNSLINLFAGMPPDQMLSINANRIHYDQISVIGSFGTTPEMMSRSAEIIASGRIDLSSLVSHHYRLSDVERAITDTENYTGLRCVVDRF
jgi:L-iditol 2-dehydrogenase